MKAPHWHPPAQWDEAKYRDLFRKIRSEAKAVASGAPPESWSHNQDLLFRVARVWSLSVVRLVRAILGLLTKRDVQTPLALIRQLNDRSQDLCLLASFEPPKQRHDAACRALLWQILVHKSRGDAQPEWRRGDWSTIPRSVTATRQRMSAESYEEVAKAAKDWRNPRHWSGEDDPAKRQARTGVPPQHDRIFRTMLAMQSHQSLDLFEVNTIALAPNVKDYTPARTASDEWITVVGLMVWFYLRAADDAANRIYQGDA